MGGTGGGVTRGGGFEGEGRGDAHAGGFQEDSCMIDLDVHDRCVECFKLCARGVVSGNMVM